MSEPMPVMVDRSLLCILLRLRSQRPLSVHAKAARMDWRTINRLARAETKAPRFDQGVLLLDIAADHLTTDDWHRVRVAEGQQT